MYVCVCVCVCVCAYRNVSDIPLNPSVENAQWSRAAWSALKANTWHQFFHSEVYKFLDYIGVLKFTQGFMECSGGWWRGEGEPTSKANRTRSCCGRLLWLHQAGAFISLFAYLTLVKSRSVPILQWRHTIPCNGSWSRRKTWRVVRK